ncbi:MAG: tetratricopeptide repeat protein [Pyrinomonadaceae bacterium]
MKLRVVLICVLLFLPVLAAQAGEVWTRVTSKNFTLIGSTDEKEIRRVAMQLEQFRETFQQLFPNRKFNTAPTTVILFKNEQDLKLFQPIQFDGKAANSATGYFQAGDDVNYVVFAPVGESKAGLQAIFHDYAHFIINKNFGRAVVPPWLNEGLAEYYQTFELENDENLRLGKAAEENLRLLKEQNLIPLERLFALDYYTLRNQRNHGKSIFYAESWALIHYLLEGNKGDRREQLKVFLNLLPGSQSPNMAFANAFQIDLATIDKELKNYVAKQLFTNRIVKAKPTFASEMQSAPLTEAEAIAYQGDLLLHLNRFDEAAKLLRASIMLDAKNALASAALGATLNRQNKFDEAHSFLEKAVALGADNYLPYFYEADALWRETVNDENFLRPFADERTMRLHELLTRSIKLNPNFTPAYRLLALINLANNTNLNEAIAALNKALLLEPGNQQYALDLGRIYLRQEKFDQARHLVASVFASAEEEKLRANAQILVNNVNSLENQLREIRERNARRNVGEDQSPTIELTQEEAINQSLNEALRKPKLNEKRVVGYLSQIDCDAKTITFVIRSKNPLVSQNFKLRAPDFLSVAFMAFTAEASGKAVSCGVRQPEDFVVVTYRSLAEAKANFDGEIVAVEFVPKTFELRP